jgi:hypothetical protein
MNFQDASRVVVDGGNKPDSDGGREDGEEYPPSPDSPWGWDSNGILFTNNVSRTALLEPLAALADAGTNEGVDTDQAAVSREIVIEHTAFHPAVYVRSFGSFTAALEKALVAHEDISGVLDEEVMDAIHRRSRELDRPVTPNDIDDEFIVSVEEILHRFGKWNNALYEANIENIYNKDLTEDEQYLLYRKEAGSYESGFGEHGFLTGWDEHNRVMDFFSYNGERPFSTRKFSTSVDIDFERAVEMLEFLDSMGLAEQDESDGEWVVRVEDQENAAGWLRRGVGLSNT